MYKIYSPYRTHGKIHLQKPIIPDEPRIWFEKKIQEKNLRALEGINHNYKISKRKGEQHASYK